MKVALLTDCYLPRLGGIEVQTHDLAAAARGPGPRRRGLHRDAGGARRAARVRRGRRRRRRCTGWRCGCRGSCRSTRSRRRRCGAGCAQAASTWPTCTWGWSAPSRRTWPGWRSGSGCPRRSRGTASWSARSRSSARSGTRAAGARGARPCPPSRRSRPRRCRRSSVTVREVAVLPNGIDVGRWRPPARAVPGPDEPVRVVAAMRLAARKRPLALLRGAAPGPSRLVGDPAADAADDVRRGAGARAARAVRRTARHGRLRAAARPGGPRRAARRATGAATPTSRRPGSRRSGSRRWRRARPGCRSCRAADTGVGDFVVDGVNGLLAARRRRPRPGAGPARRATATCCNASPSTTAGPTPSRTGRGWLRWRRRSTAGQVPR